MKVSRGSLKATAARRTQGQYIGLLRKFTGQERPKVKAVAAKDGVAAAVAFGTRLLEKR